MLFKLNSFNNYLILLVAILPFSFINHASAQTYFNNYEPIVEYRIPKKELNEIRLSYEKKAGKFIEPNKQIKKDVTATIKGSGLSVVRLDSMGQLMYTDTLSKYVQSVVLKIQNSNPELKDKVFKVFIHRTDVPNAVSRGEGVIFVNLDIITKIRSEDQLAFILSHEICHDYLNHYDKGIKSIVDLSKNPEYQREIKRIEKLEYNQESEVEKLLLRMLAKYTIHKRENELACDSLGLIFFNRCGYNTNEAISTIELLDSTDGFFVKEKVQFEKHFHFPDAPFDNTLLMALNNTVDIGGNLDSIKLPDSLKTHPDCIYRAQRLREIIKRNNFSSNTTTKTNNDQFRFYQNIAYHEAIEFFMDYQAYSKALYIALTLADKHPDSDYLKCAINNCLYEIYVAQKKHNFSLIVDHPNKYYSKNYTQLLTMLHQISLSGIKKMTQKFFRYNLHGSDRYFFAEYVTILVASIEQSPEETEQMRKSFEIKHKNSYLCNRLNNRFPTPKKK